MMIYWISIVVILLLAPSVLFGEGEDIRDPFEAYLSKAAQASNQDQTAQGKISNLEGIGIGPKGAFAVISGEVYYEGERKGFVKVTQIRKKEVDTLVGGVPTTLRMIPQGVLAPPEGEPVQVGGSSETVQKQVP